MKAEAGGCWNLPAWNSQKLFGANVSVISINERAVWPAGKGVFKPNRAESYTLAKGREPAKPAQIMRSR